jgi:hypothetical protein
VAALKRSLLADGVMIATLASPGQGRLRVSFEKAPPEIMSVIIVQNRWTGEGMKYALSRLAAGHSWAETSLITWPGSMLQRPRMAF